MISFEIWGCDLCKNFLGLRIKKHTEMATTFDTVYANMRRGDKLKGGEDEFPEDPTDRISQTESNNPTGNSTPDSGGQQQQQQTLLKEIAELQQEQRQEKEAMEQERTVLESKIAELEAERNVDVATREQRVVEAVDREIENVVSQIGDNIATVISQQLNRMETSVSDMGTALKAGGELEHIAARVMSVAPNAETNARAGMEGMRITLETLSQKNPSLQALHDVWVGLYAEHRDGEALPKAAPTPAAPTTAAPTTGPTTAAPSKTPVVGLVPIVVQLVEEHDAARRTGDRDRAAAARAVFEEHMWTAMDVRYELPPFAWEEER